MGFTDYLTDWKTAPSTEPEGMVVKLKFPIAGAGLSIHKKEMIVIIISIDIFTQPYIESYLK